METFYIDKSDKNIFLSNKVRPIINSKLLNLVKPRKSLLYIKVKFSIYLISKYLSKHFLYFTLYSV